MKKTTKTCFPSSMTLIRISTALARNPPTMVPDLPVTRKERFLMSTMTKTIHIAAWVMKVRFIARVTIWRNPISMML